MEGFIGSGCIQGTEFDILIAVGIARWRAFLWVYDKVMCAINIVAVYRAGELRSCCT